MAAILAENQPVWIACARLSVHQIKVTPSADGVVPGILPREKYSNYYPVVTVDDGIGGIVSRQYGLTVIDPNNQAPVIHNPSVTEAYAGQPYYYELNATDGDALEYRLYYGPEGLSISADGVVSGTLTREQVGMYWPQVKAKDAFGGDHKISYSLTVTDPDNQAPVINNEPVLLAVVGELYQYDLQATDADGDSLTVTTHPLAINFPR